VKIALSAKNNTPRSTGALKSEQYVFIYQLFLLNIVAKHGSSSLAVGVEIKYHRVSRVSAAPPLGAMLELKKRIDPV
jgi:hypothetical protein